MATAVAISHGESTLLANIKKGSIKLKVYGSQRYYLRTLPLHHSQVEMERHEDWSLFSLRLRPTLDF